MRYCICIICFIAGMFQPFLFGQVSLIADPLSGCDSVLVTFGLYPPQAADTITTISWTFSNGVNVNNELQPVVKFNTPGYFSVTCVINGNTTITETDMIFVYSGPCDEIIEVPNVFSPNGDGVNDYFKIRTNGLNLFALTVYTRSGVLVYKLESPDLIWDGRTLSGHEMRPGIYYYVIEQTDGGGGIKKTGFVHLIRE